MDWNSETTKKHIKEAKAVGLTLIGAGRDAHYRTYRFNDCGHEQEIFMHNVRDDFFTCNICEETSRDLPSKVYLLKIEVDKIAHLFTWLKLGYTKNISKRIKQYRLPSESKITRLKVINFSKGRDANKFESSLQSKYRKKRLPIKKMKEFHTGNGYNECYPLKMLDTLMDELNNIET